MMAENATNGAPAATGAPPSLDDLKKLEASAKPADAAPKTADPDANTWYEMYDSQTGNAWWKNALTDAVRMSKKPEGEGVKIIKEYEEWKQVQRRHGRPVAEDGGMCSAAGCVVC